MKKQNQVRKSSSKTAAASQAKTKLSPTAGAVTCVWTGPDGKEVARVDFQRELWSLIERTTSELGITLQQFFDNAIIDKMNVQAARGKAPRGLLPFGPDKDHPTCLCLYDAGVGEVVAEVPLVKRLLPDVVIAAVAQALTVDQFIAAAIKEKLHASRSKHQPTALDQAARGKVPSGFLPYDPEKDSPTCLCFYDRTPHPGGGVVSQIPLNEEVLETLFTSRLRGSASAVQFVADAIKEKLAKLPDAERRPSLALEKFGFFMGDLVLKLADKHGTEIGETFLAANESGLLQKAGAVLGLNLADLIGFMVHRQLETFYPPEVQGVWRVAEDVLSEISRFFADAEKYSNSLWSVCRALNERIRKLEELKSPAECVTSICELNGLSATIEKLSSSVRVEVADANMHWRNSARPALLEQHVPTGVQPADRRAA